MRCKDRTARALPLGNMASRTGWMCALALVACGGGMVSGYKSEDKDAAPATLEEAQRQLEAARAELAERETVVLGGQNAATRPAAVQPESSDGARGPEDDCARLCRAFASMQRAQAAICRLAGEADARCADAKKSVAESATRVAHCGCHG